MKLPYTYSRSSCAKANQKMIDGCALLQLKDNSVFCQFVSCIEKHPSVCTTNKTSKFIILHDIIDNRFTPIVQALRATFQQICPHA